MQTNSSQAPLGYKASHFRQARRLTLATSQAAGALWEFQWAPVAGNICFVKRVTLKGNQIANATAEELRFNLKVARTFTVADTTNTASILLSGDMQKLSGSMADSLLTAFRESNSATAPTGGTKTLDTDALAIGSYVTIATVSTTVAGAPGVIFDFSPFSDNCYPLRLERNEGWVISIEATKGATQGFTLYMETEWDEYTKTPAI